MSMPIRIERKILAGQVLNTAGQWVSLDEALEEYRTLVRNVHRGKIQEEGTWIPLDQPSIPESVPPAASRVDSPENGDTRKIDLADITADEVNPVVEEIPGTTLNSIDALSDMAIPGLLDPTETVRVEIPPQENTDPIGHPTSPSRWIPGSLSSGYHRTTSEEISPLAIKIVIGAISVASLSALIIVLVFFL